MFLLFFSIILVLFGLMQYRLYRLIRSWIRKAIAPGRRPAWLRRTLVGFLVFNVLFLAQMVVRGTPYYELPLFQFTLIYPTSIVFGIIVFSFLLVSVVDIPRLLIRVASVAISRARGFKPVRPEPSDSEAAFDQGRRRFLRIGGVTAASAVSSLPVFAALTTARDYQLNRIDIVSPRVPPSLDGLTIAQVSDIHSGVFMTHESMNEIFDLVNGFNADMIVVTGDFVDSSDVQIEPLARSIRMLKADLGVFGCLGNHDHFATAAKVSAAVEQSGVVMLNNSSVAKSIDGGTLSLLGIDDAGRGMSNFADVGRTLAGVDPESFKIMLTHRPEMWDQCRKLGMDLTLAGHTHGGQVGFRLGPLNLNPVYLVHKYPMGHFIDGPHHLYVNVGVGMVGVPIRMVKPELSLFTLRRVSAHRPR